MLEHSFIHVPGIGPHRERELWVAGYTDWEAFRSGYPEGHWRELVLDRLERERAARDMPRREAWRLFPSYRDRVAYLDIETAEIAGERDVVTCVGLFDGKNVEAYLRGLNLNELPAALGRFELLVTYNGACYDLPVLTRAFPGLEPRRLRHIDLRFPLGRLGFRGGLKAAEREIGIERPEEIRDVDGRLAIRLWQAHRRGHPRALDTLTRYCLEDVVNLEPLMVHAYNTIAASLPLEVAPLSGSARPAIPWRADRDLVGRLADVYSSR